MGTTTIEWTATYHEDGTVSPGESWNYATGGHCEASPGCTNCYARVFAERWRGTAGHHYEQGFDLRVWPERLSWPITRWKKGRRIFVNSMGDWLLSAIPTEVTLQAFETMLSANQHTYQLLSKRPGWLGDSGLFERIMDLVEQRTGQRRWPSHIWLGTTVECQGYREAGSQRGRVWDTRWRIDKLRQPFERAGLLDGSVTLFVSAEPLLTPLVLNLHGIHWLIAGAESGHGARPMDEDWVRSLRDQALASGTRFFYKQKADAHGHKIPLPVLDGRVWNDFPDGNRERRASEDAPSAPGRGGRS